MPMKHEAAFKAVRERCLAKEDVAEEYPWGSVVWKTAGRIFAIGTLGHNAFTIKASRADQSVLVQHRAVEPAAYVGRFGWVTVTVTGRESLALALDLVDQSYEGLRKRRRGTSRKTGREAEPGGPPPGWDS